MRLLRLVARHVLRLLEDPTVRDLAKRVLKQVGRWLLKKLSAAVMHDKPRARRERAAAVAFS